MKAGDKIKAVVHKNETIDYLNEDDSLIITVAMDTVYEKGSAFYDHLLEEAVS
jgi:hypothetical protein